MQKNEKCGDRTIWFSVDDLLLFLVWSCDLFLDMISCFVISGAVYENVIWQGMKWRYRYAAAADTSPSLTIVTRAVSAITELLVVFLFARWRHCSETTIFQRIRWLRPICNHIVETSGDRDYRFSNPVSRDWENTEPRRDMKKVICYNLFKQIVICLNKL